MKKTYMKPGMYVENFNLSQSVAAGGCGAAQNPTFGKPGFANKIVCGWDVGTGQVWMTPSPCNIKGGQEFEGMCYNNPSSNVSIFSLS